MLEEVCEKPLKWYLMSLNYNNSHLVKLLVERGVKIIGIEKDLDKFIVLSSTVGDGLFYGGLLSGYALIRCRFSDSMYYLLLGIPQAYGLIKSNESRPKIGQVIDVEKTVVEISQEEVDRLLGVCMKRVETKKFFSVGNDVRIIQGPFLNFKGKILSISKNKIEVQVSLLGRTVPVHIEIEGLEHA